LTPQEKIIQRAQQARAAWRHHDHNSPYDSPHYSPASSRPDRGLDAGFSR
jgi:hypothetical protein